MIMGEDESDEHLKIFECLVNTGALVLRSSLERKVLHNIPITFEQYLENTKHQFYHQFERNRNKPCCSGQPHNCYVNGNMDKKIFYKVYNKISESDYQHCLDRFKVKADVSIDKLDLSDLNFFLWNSNTLSQQEVQSLQTIMTIRSAICHPQSSHCYSINDLEHFWVSLQNAVLLFAEPDSYKKIVTLLITTQKRSKVNEIESNRIINEMHTESENITHELKLEVQARNDCTNQLMKDESVGVKNCINNKYDKTTSFINETAQKLTENHKVLTTRCIEEIKTTVTEESSNTRLHNEDQRRAIDSQLTESENRVCQTVIHSGGRLEDKLTEQQNEIRKHNVELNADLMEENRKLREIKELRTILIGQVGKQKVELVMNTEETERSNESQNKERVEMTVKVNQTHVTEYKENEIIENLPPVVEIQTNNDCSPESAVTETIEITGKRVNSIILELKATPGILHSVENFKAAILTLVQVMQTAGGIDVNIEDTVTVNLRFGGPLTKDQLAVVECLFAHKWNDGNNTKQLSTEYSSTPYEYLSIGVIKDIEVRTEIVSDSQKETSDGVPPETIKHLSKPFCQSCEDKEKKIKALKKQHEKELLESQYKLDMPRLQEENRKLKHVVEGLQTKNSKLKHITRGLPEENSKLKHDVEGLKEENSKLKGLEEENSKLKHVVKGLKEEISELKGTGLVNPRRDDTRMISMTGTLGMKQKEIKSDDLSSLLSKQAHRDSFMQRVETINLYPRSMELQPRVFQVTTGRHQTHDKSSSSYRISERSHEYSGNLYPKAEGQKGLAVIVYSNRGFAAVVTNLQVFFEEMGFVVQCIDEKNYYLPYRQVPDGNFYCVFLVLVGPVEINFTNIIRRILRKPGQPLIVMTDSSPSPSIIRETTKETDTLMVMPFGPFTGGSHQKPDFKPAEHNILDYFMKVTRGNRFTDIMDILTRMNELYDYPVITFKSSLRKKLSFL